MKRVTCLALLVFCAQSNAANTWYWGKVNNIITLHEDGSFIVKLENDDIESGCLYSRVQFMVPDMGSERTKAAFSLAMTAFAADKEWGVVINMPIDLDVCRASSTASQGAGIR